MKKILIVDDNQQNLYMLQVLLSANGFQVEQALNGAEALERARRTPPDMIVSDILMPVMDGYALCREWKEDERLKNIPFVFYSATYTEPKDEAFALSLGADRFIIKPTEPDKFLVLLLETEKDYEAGKTAAASKPMAAAEYYKEYNATLIRKLEDKMLQLEEANRTLEKDIVEQKQKEEALRASEEKWRLLVQTIPDYVAVHDREGRFEYLNRYAVGYSEKDVIGKSMYDFVSSGSKELFRKKFEECVKSAKTIAFEFRAMGDNGVMRDYDNYIVPIKRQDTVTNVMVISRDITERKKAEEQLLESKALFEAVVENVPLMIFLKEAKDLRFVIFNRAGEELLGYDRQALLGKNNLDLFPPEQAAHFMAKDREVLDGEAGMLDIPEEPIMTANNGQRLLHTRKVCIRGDDGITKYLLGISEDITERKQTEEKQKKLEEQLRQSQKLESIGQLSSGVAHDFNNLLGGIMGHAELLKMGLEKDSPLIRHPDGIIAGCTKAADLTRQLLSFARKAPVDFQKVDLNAFLKQVKKLLDRTIDRRIEIITGIPDQPVYISGDRNQLENALLNIAINARDAMPEGGRLHITSETVDLNKNEFADEHYEVVEGTYAKISIEDTGTGMSQEVKDRIFEPFFTTKEVGKGTGLGLASVYGCVKQHEGYIHVESQVGKGTKFDVFLPVVKTDKPMVDVKEEAVLVQGKGSLLVVDDEPVYHGIIDEIFGKAGYTVHSCASGPEAIAFYREHGSAIDIVILDMNMPKMNGLQCFRGIKEINPKVKVIVSSGYGDSKDRQTMQKEGVSVFVQKPFRAADLAKKIRELIAS